MFGREILIAGLLGTLLLIALMVLGRMARKSRPDVSFFCGFFLTTLAPIGFILQFINPFAEYRLYLSNIALFFFMACFLEWILKRVSKNIFKLTLVGGLLVFFSICTFQESLLWADPLMLVEYSIERYPKSDFLNAMLGSVLQDRGRFAEAEKAYMESDRLNENSGRDRTLRPQFMLVGLYESQSRWQVARQLLERLPISGLKRGPPVTFFQHYLKILKELNDREQYKKILEEGEKHYPRAVLLTLVSSQGA